MRFAKTDLISYDFVATLKSEVDLSSQGDVGGFSGIEVKCTAHAHLDPVQPGLVHNIISIFELANESNEH